MADFIAFGEILFDCFPDGRATLGGAPLNCAGHMSKLGLEGYMLSAVGNDELGKRALEEISRLGMDTSHIQVLEGVETGRADIQLVGKNADYTFNSPAAWDKIKPEAAPGKVRLVYFGTLAQRSRESREALYTLLDQAHPEEVFFDVNLRKQFYTKDIILHALDYATILKMNDEEVPVVLSLAGIKAQGRQALSLLSTRFGLKTVLITEGKQGTSCLSGGRWYHEDIHDVPVMDTVGAGDSLSAGFLATLLLTGDIGKAVRVGSMLADYVVTQRGAIPEYDGKLKEFLKKEGL